MTGAPISRFATTDFGGSEAEAAIDRAPLHPAAGPGPVNRPGLRRVIGVALLGSLCLNGIGLAIPLFSMTVYDKVIPHGAFDTLAAMVIVALALISIEWLVRVARATVLDLLADDLAGQAEGGAYESLLSARPDAMPISSAAVSAMLRDGDDVRAGFAAGSASAVADAMFAVLYIATVLLIGGWIATVALVASALLGGVAWYAWRQQQALRAPASQAAAMRHGVLAETVRAITTLRRWSQQMPRRVLWTQATEHHARTAQAARRNAARVSTIQAAAQNAAMVAALAVGTPAAVGGTISIGTLIACMLLTSRTVAAAASLASTLPRLATARLALASAARMAALPREDGEHAVNLGPGSGSLYLDRITVRYPDADQPVLRDLSLALQAGQRLAISGPSGSGKSTLERAIYGELALESGRILLDGTDLALARRSSVRRAVIGIPQVVDVLGGTLRDNIALGRPIDDGRLAAALEILGPAGRSLLATGFRLDRLIPEGGRGLSGGQVQAIAIARVLVDSVARLVILDEPTTGLDAESEEAAITALQAWLATRTVLVMSHRAAVVQRLAHGAVLLDRGALSAVSSRTQARQAG